MNRIRQTMLCCLAACLMATPGFANPQEDAKSEGKASTEQQKKQASDDKTSRQADRSEPSSKQARDQRDSDRGMKSQRSNQDDKSPKQASSQRDRAKLKLEPAGWLRIAVDYDNDGSFDAVETIYTYDLQRAQQSSRERANRDAQKMTEKQREEGTQDGRREPSRQEQLTGEILQLREAQLFGLDGPCLLARIRTEENMPAKVVLGPRKRLRSWKLREGDQVTIKGRRGRVNDRPMLIADKIMHDGKQMNVQLPSSKAQKRLTVELVGMRTTKFRGHDGEFVLAKVRRQNGELVYVNLGPKQKVGKLDLNEGDELRLLARPARINGQPGMVADQIRANGETVTTTPPMIARTRRDRRSIDALASRQSRKGKAENRQTRSSDDARSIARRDQDEPRQERSRRNRGATSEQEQDRAALGLAVAESRQGVEVLAIHPDSPVAGADLEEGDQILAINGKQIRSALDLMETVGDQAPDDRVRIRFQRNGEEKSIRVRLTSRQRLLGMTETRR